MSEIETKAAGPAAFRFKEEQSEDGAERVSARNTMMVATERDWHTQAACQSADPDLFFPVSESGRSLDQAATAKAFCARCQVLRECLAFALATRQAHGIWGGTTEQERRLAGRTKCTRTLSRHSRRRRA